ncbi:branched-chain amino acid ABC transporter permease [Xanthobacter tagetidis]|jgi:branched-chain amino acid transport system permease protein|uniref:Branched-chain amino acid ABC transporter permease n=1 Tax=Xanthobacter tagetidis TaxID=60216 RepID=A0A3L7A6D0_9HYPH|nr:branched-chain amino acid ABC transporter permease [Xanthobacter tagetidis]MBB6307353.1 branched-chain amino acid transport system permease protein [Xanthobacter tagetidis]RLP75886.1 branched-chain amino acid ABC transporter permease [Xanthobacter tagetidis]
MRAAGIALIVALVAALASLPLVLPAFGLTFWVNVVAEILIWSLLAASVNLLFGYVGLLSFGQALYFGFGMYGTAIGISMFGLGLWPALALGIVASTGMAAVAGAFAVRLTWHYFAIITVVFSLIFYFVAMSQKWLTGGDDGLSFSAPPILEAAGWMLTDRTTQYYFIFLVCLACYALLALVVASPLGLRFAAVRENEKRAQLIGINVYATRWIAFVLAGFIAGVGGALLALFGRYASASYMFYHVSGEAVVWAIVGGAGTLLGPLVGTALLIIFREVVSGLWENYLMAVGAITILVVIFAPKGLVGSLTALVRRGESEEREHLENPGIPATPATARAEAE